MPACPQCFTRLDVIASIATEFIIGGSEVGSAWGDVDFVGVFAVGLPFFLVKKKFGVSEINLSCLVLRRGGETELEGNKFEREKKGEGAKGVEIEIGIGIIRGLKKKMKKKRGEEKRKKRKNLPVEVAVIPILKCHGTDGIFPAISQSHYILSNEHQS